MGTLTLILGGARSGKSHHAEKLAAEIGGDSVLYVATAQPFDDEMKARIAQHQAERPAGWSTVEAPNQAALAIEKHYATSQLPEKVVLLDCLTVLTSNLLLPFDDPFAPEVEVTINRETDGLIQCIQSTEAHFLIVSNEVGLGLVPPYPLGRAYRDLLGRANQRLAQIAEKVLFMVAGLPMIVKE
ncbi:MAG: bifunctional adenosylcobinamide kinase/adenosylcobinamide-phosphate guanylyltransferase [Chloroflexota bacterium]